MTVLSLFHYLKRIPVPQDHLDQQQSTADRAPRPIVVSNDVGSRGGTTSSGATAPSRCRFFSFVLLLSLITLCTVELVRDVRCPDYGGIGNSIADVVGVGGTVGACEETRTTRTRSVKDRAMARKMVG